MSSCYTTNNATCCDLSAYHIPQPTPAVYKIDCCWCDAPFEATKVYCDPSGGWTIIQRRKDGSDENFNRPWADYEKEFRNLILVWAQGLELLNSNWPIGTQRVNFEFHMQQDQILPSP